MSGSPSGPRWSLLSYMLIRNPSGTNPSGMVHEIVGVNPLPEIVTSTGKGTGCRMLLLLIPSRVGPLTLSWSGPFWKIKVQGCRRFELKPIARAQKFALVASGSHAPWETVKPVGG